DDDEDDTILAEVVVEVRKTKNTRRQDIIDGQNLHRFLQIEHKWGGTTWLNLQSTAFEIKPIELLTVDERYKEKRKELLKDPKNTSKQVELLEDLAHWCLSHGKLLELKTVMAELRELKPDSQKLKDFFRVQQLIDQTPTKPDLADYWKDKLGSYTTR